MVAAMGAFAGDSTDSNVDLQYYQVARNSISLEVIEKGSLCYVQGLTIMANYLQKRNKPNAGFALIGIAWSMALAIGLHREFGTSSTTAYTMEQRRRTWWTLFIFVSGAQLTLGRPPASLVGINLRLPTNLDDASLSVDMSELPGAQEGRKCLSTAGDFRELLIAEMLAATVTACLIAQARLAQIANEVQTELLSNQVPTSQRVEALRNQIRTWQAELPPCFDENMSSPAWFELPKRILLWRSSHLKIVLDRPLLFRAVTDKVDLSKCEGPVWECINTADHCISAICNFLETNDSWRRGFAWYATYWLVSASFVHAVCFAYSPASPAKEHWRTRLRQAVRALQKLGSAHRKAGQAEHVLGRLLGRIPPDNVEVCDLTLAAGTTQHSPPAIPDMDTNWTQALTSDTSLVDFSMNYFGMRDPELLEPLSMDMTAFEAGGDGAMWLQPEGPNAEFSDAAGGITLSNFSQAWQQP